MIETKPAIEARKLLRDCGLEKTRPVNLATIIKTLGLNATYKEDLTDYALLNPMDKTIYVLKNDQPIRDKIFAVAHEIGHWTLHSRDKERPRFNFNGKDRPSDKVLIEEEREANAFAFELLMPYEETRNLIIFGYSVNYIASHFGVPIETAYRRYNEIHQMLY